MAAPLVNIIVIIRIPGETVKLNIPEHIGGVIYTAVGERAILFLPLIVKLHKFLELALRPGGEGTQPEQSQRNKS